MNRFVLSYHESSTSLSALLPQPSVWITLLGCTISNWWSHTRPFIDSINSSTWWTGKPYQTKTVFPKPLEMVNFCHQEGCKEQTVPKVNCSLSLKLVGRVEHRLDIAIICWLWVRKMVRRHNPRRECLFMNDLVLCVCVCVCTEVGCTDRAALVNNETIS